MTLKKIGGKEENKYIHLNNLFNTLTQNSCVGTFVLFNELKISCVWDFYVLQWVEYEERSRWMFKIDYLIFLIK